MNAMVNFNNQIMKTMTTTQKVVRNFFFFFFWSKFRGKPLVYDINILNNIHSSGFIQMFQGLSHQKHNMCFHWRPKQISLTLVLQC